MKKLLTLLLAVLLFTTLFAGCSGKDAAPFSKADLYLTIGGSKYVCDGNVQDLLSVFGDGYEYSEAISCAYDGLDKIFSYDGLDIYTRPEGEKDLVSELCAYEDVTSSKGIAIGASADEVRTAYGEPTQQTGRLLKYVIAPASAESDGASLYFKLADGKVSAIGVTAEILIGED